MKNRILETYDYFTLTYEVKNLVISFHRVKIGKSPYFNVCGCPHKFN